MSLSSLGVKLGAPLPELERFDRYLFIGPHPDDIEIGAGATAARLAAMGKQVSFLICTDGRFGYENLTEPLSPEALAAVRREEAIASARVLGVKEPVFLGLSDGGLYTQEALLSGMARVIGALQPEVLFAPDPCVSSECHADHLNVGQAARRLAYFAPVPPIMEALGAQSAPVKALVYYMTARPNRYVATAATFRRQWEAICCHKSQFPPGCAAAQSLSVYLRLRAADYGLRRLCGRAEGFRVLGQTQMHCLPEAGR